MFIFGGKVAGERDVGGSEELVTDCQSAIQISIRLTDIGIFPSIGADDYCSGSYRADRLLAIHLGPAAGLQDGELLAWRYALPSSHADGPAGFGAAAHCRRLVDMAGAAAAAVAEES